MTPMLRKINLTAHVAFSVAWIGAAAAFFVLSIVGLTSRDHGMVRGVYVSMNLICLYSIVPLSLVALGTGLIQSLGTQWGLFRHYWVLAKFLLTTLSIAVLLMHQFAAMKASKLALESAGSLSGTELTAVGFVLFRASGLGILVLLVVTTLSVYKPWGLTSYGWRMQQQARLAGGVKTMSGSSDSPFRGLKPWLAIGIGVVVLALIISIHITGHGFHHGH